MIKTAARLAVALEKQVTVHAPAGRRTAGPVLRCACTEDLRVVSGKPLSKAGLHRIWRQAHNAAITTEWLATAIYCLCSKVPFDVESLGSPFRRNRAPGLETYSGLTKVTILIMHTAQSPAITSM